MKLSRIDDFLVGGSPGDVATDRFGASRCPERLEFSSAATAAKKLATKQAEALSAEESALGKIKSQLTAFRVK